MTFIVVPIISAVNLRKLLICGMIVPMDVYLLGEES
jgi:hypothetical protein